MIVNKMNKMFVNESSCRIFGLLIEEIIIHLLLTKAYRESSTFRMEEGHVFSRKEDRRITGLRAIRCPRLGLSCEFLTVDFFFDRDITGLDRNTNTFTKAGVECLKKI